MFRARKCKLSGDYHHECQLSREPLQMHVQGGKLCCIIYFYRPERSGWVLKYSRAPLSILYSRACKRDNFLERNIVLLEYLSGRGRSGRQL
ncbi:hypothetical protein NPIL_421751 [Nephila pilipes]|uniref:Uncharacterized protein n=1 Tax=Nephila pilipes TaxID=299642 RepID=A0A8X6TN38_NEPPI|nr:hypothetical protein NPIL_421751 [Nephila pilipes]